MTKLTAEGIVDSLVVKDVQISPDGMVVAFVVASIGQADEYSRSAIWISATDGSMEARRLTAGTAHDREPRWSPDGDALYFLSDRADRDFSQIYRIRLNGGEAEILTEWDPRVAEMVSAPSAEHVLFLAVDAKTAEDKRRAEERDDAEVYGEKWRYQRLRVLDLSSRAVTTIEAIGDLHVAEAVPSSDGSQIAVITWPTTELDTSLRQAELWVVDIATPRARRVCNLPYGGRALTWSVADRELLFLAHRASDLRGGTAVFAVDANGGRPRQVTGDLPACPVEVAGGNGVPYVLMAEGLDSWLGRLDVASGQLERIVELRGDASCLSINADGEAFAVARRLADDLSGVWAGRIGSNPSPLTDLNPDLRSVDWGTQERLSWLASDELEIQGLLILPMDATRSDGPFPLVTLVHGGPYHRFADALQLDTTLWGQWLATAGYAVLLPNPRGGLGRGHGFADQVAGAVGTEDWTDIQAGIDHLVGAGIADPSRLAIGGWSQGGFMSAWAVGQTDRFKASIMGAGVSDWGMMVATSDLPHFEAMLGGSAGWEGPGPHRHDALSPISYASQAVTPVLILHGAEDARVPVSQGRLFAQALREHGIPNQLVVYPREGHVIGERNHQLDLLGRVRDWIERGLGAGFGA